MTAAATRTLSSSRAIVSIVLPLVSLSHVIKFESGAIRSVTPPIITLITAYVPEDREIKTGFYFNMKHKTNQRFSGVEADQCNTINKNYETMELTAVICSS